jgi:hypothetical protein
VAALVLADSPLPCIAAPAPLSNFYASALIAANCDVVAVQRALGHGSASVTLNTYGHLWPEANDRTRQAARDLYAQATAYRES